MKIKVGLADDHPIFRKGMNLVISSENNFDLIWEAQNGKEVLENTSKDSPDVLILDIEMPDMDGIQVASVLKKECPKVKTVFLSMHKDIQLLDIMKKSKVMGYILKDSALNEVVDCINEVFKGKRYLSKDVTELLFTEDEQESSSDISYLLVSGLTNSEKLILSLIMESKTSKNIAEKLYISPRTVENHRFNICKKLKLKGNHALVKFALSNKTHIQKMLTTI